MKTRKISKHSLWVSFDKLKFVPNGNLEKPKSDDLSTFTKIKKECTAHVQLLFSTSCNTETRGLSTRRYRKYPPIIFSAFLGSLSASSWISRLSGGFLCVFSSHRFSVRAMSANFDYLICYCTLLEFCSAGAWRYTEKKTGMNLTLAKILKYSIQLFCQLSSLNN